MRRGARDVVQFVECSPGVSKTLGLILSTSLTGNGGACLEAQLLEGGGRRSEDQANL